LWGRFTINSHASGAVFGGCDITLANTDAYAGGLVGHNNDSHITNSSATGTVVSQAYSISRAGGLVGYQESGYIVGSHATGPVTATADDDAAAGGLIGKTDNAGWNGVIIKFCYATGDAITSGGSDSYAGGLAGIFLSGSLTYCYYNSEAEITGTTVCTEGTGLTETEFADWGNVSVNFIGFNFDKDWVMGPSHPLLYATIIPVLSASTPADNTTGVSAELSEITLTFEAPVTVADSDDLALTIADDHYDAKYLDISAGFFAGLTSSTDLNFTTANAAPAVAITSHSSGDTVTDAAITISGTASDANGITGMTIALSGATTLAETALSISSGTGVAWSHDATLSEGVTLVTVTATDAYGTTASKSIAVSYAPDSDGDGTSDNDDQCTDDPDKTEAGVCGCGVADTDTDSDGTADCVDTDDDDDGLSDDIEASLGTDPLAPDTDGDGIDDGVEVDSNLDPLTAENPGVPAMVSPENGKTGILLAAPLEVSYETDGLDSYHAETRWQIATD
jgi:hypothetical protein